MTGIIMSGYHIYDMSYIYHICEWSKHVNWQNGVKTSITLDTIIRRLSGAGPVHSSDGWPKAFGPCAHLGDLQEAPAAHLCTEPTLSQYWKCKYHARVVPNLCQYMVYKKGNVSKFVILRFDCSLLLSLVTNCGFST